MQTCAKQHVAGSWVPGDDAHSLGVPLKHHHRLCQRGDQPVLRDLPHLSRRGGGVGEAGRSSEAHARPRLPGSLNHTRDSRPATVPRLTMTVQSSEPLAMTSSLWGHQSMSRTGPVCPHTVG